jgi:hypothetical protein
VPDIPDESYAKPWGKLRLLTFCERGKGGSQLDIRYSIFNLGEFRMHHRNKAIAAAVLSLAALAVLVPTGSANAADDLPPPPVKAKPVQDLPFFLVVDDRMTFSYQFTATDPGVFSIRPNGTVDGTTAKQVYSFTHFDVWGYGTNFFNIDLLKSDHNDPANGCGSAPVTSTNIGCAGATEVYGLFRSTFGWNEIFNTKAFSMGPLHNISFEIGADMENENSALAPAKRDFVGGLQFTFDLPYKGYFNVSPLAYKEINHVSFDTCAFGVAPSTGCSADGNTDYHTTWAVETNYYMDLGFLPESVRYFAISGRAGWYGPKGNQDAPLTTTGGTATKTELNSEPIRLTFDASKAFLGAKYSHFAEVWVAYRYWQNKFGLDHSLSPTCNIAPGVSNNSCTEQSASAGITVKF